MWDARFSCGLCSFTQPCNDNERQEQKLQSERAQQVDDVEHQLEAVVKPDAAKDVVPVGDLTSGTRSSAPLPPLLTCLPVHYYRHDQTEQSFGNNEANDRYDNRETESAEVVATEDQRQRTVVESRNSPHFGNDAFQADGHRLKWTSSLPAQVEATQTERSQQKLLLSLPNATCFEGGTVNNNTKTLSSSYFPSSADDFADCTLLLSCAVNCNYCNIEISDLSVVCDHHNQEGEDLELKRETFEYGQSRPTSVGDNNELATATSVDIFTLQSVPLISVTTSDSSCNNQNDLCHNKSQHNSNKWPHLVAQGDCVNVNGQQCQSIAFDQQQVISEGDSSNPHHNGTINNQLDSCHGTYFRESSSPLLSFSATENGYEFNAQSGACHRPDIDNLLPSQLSLTLSINTTSNTASPTPPPTPTVPTSTFSASPSVFFDELYSHQPNITTPTLQLQSPGSPSVFGQIKHLKHLPRLRSSIVAFERQNSSTTDLVPSPAIISQSSPTSNVDINNFSTERFIVQIKSLLCGDCVHAQTRYRLNCILFCIVYMYLCRIVTYRFVTLPLCDYYLKSSKSNNFDL